MIKCMTLGMIEVAKNNPVITSQSDVELFDFITVDGVTYLIANTLVGDDSYKNEATLKAGEFLNGYDLAAWVDQELVVDEKHIAYASGASYADITAGTTLMTIDENGKLAVAAEAPASGFYFKVVAKCKLTEQAVRVKIMVA